MVMANRPNMNMTEDKDNILGQALGFLLFGWIDIADLRNSIWTNFC